MTQPGTRPRGTPAAEVGISPDLVRRLLAGQHPDLADRPVTVLASGWDNLVCRLGDDLLVRLPRRSMAAKLVLHEQRWLPVLAPRLPLAIPAPARTGHAAEGYPWSWSIVPYLPGQVAAVTPPADPPAAAAALGRFLRALHTPAPRDAPENPFRGVPLAQRATMVTESIALLAGVIDAATVTGRWEAAKAAPPWDGPKLWLHGDMHPANMLVHEGQVSAVIDFGDVTAGDPANDLAVAWMLFPDPAHREHLWAAYAKADDSTKARAEGWALNFALVCQANSADNPLMREIGRRTLAAVLG